MSNIQQIGVIASAVLPLFNIPLIIKLVSRKSSRDFSLVWVLGCWACTILMFPAAMVSQDLAFKVFVTVNVVLFSIVTFLVVRYRNGAKS
ncbi:MAG: hypothetical protein HZC17_08405 [Candidatus Omnitrophica bacterium]|nr:hypothetical protein [Candidatus Omnitrophota bacterium]